MKEQRSRTTYNRHRRIYSALFLLLSPFVKRRFNLHCEDGSAIEGPYLMLANHNTDWDPFIAGIALRRQMYFVASEHIFRWGLISRIIQYLVAPIPRTKGSVGGGAALAIMRHLRQGHSVGMFAEGNRSFNGVTGPIHPATAKLVKSAGVKLVTLRIMGGYFTTPRWGRGIRRGRMEVSISGVYPPEQLRSMSTAEIEALIERDIYEDAYQRQRSWQVPYRGRRRAELMETAFFLCPRCRGVDTLTGSGDRVSCRCGYSARYTETGFLEGGEFDTLTRWDSWQREQLPELLERAGDGPVFREDGVTLTSFSDHHAELSRVPGELLFYRDRLEAAGSVFYFSAMEGFSIYGRNNIVFSHEGHHMEIRGRDRFCALKYLYAYELCSPEGKGEAAERN